MQPIEFKPIGVIHTPFSKPEGAPIQPSHSAHAKGHIELLPEFRPGLSDLDGFSHIILIYHLHLSKNYKLSVKPFLDTKQRGLFSTRAPKRPNAIGLSVVRLINIEDNILNIEDVDMVDRTPLLDIKPFVPAFEEFENIRIGWLEGKAHKARETSADDRFNE